MENLEPESMAKTMYEEFFIVQPIDDPEIFTNLLKDPYANFLLESFIKRINS